MEIFVADIVDLNFITLVVSSQLYNKIKHSNFNYRSKQDIINFLQFGTGKGLKYAKFKHTIVITNKPELDIEALKSVYTNYPICDEFYRLPQIQKIAPHVLFIGSIQNSTLYVDIDVPINNLLFTKIE